MTVHRLCLISLATLTLASCSFSQAPERGAPLPRKWALGAALAPQTTEPKGVRINAVTAGLSFAESGIKVGDIVTQVDGQAVATGQEVVRALGKRNSGDTVSVTVIRDGKPTPVQVKLTPRPKMKGDGFDVVYDQVVSKGKRLRIIITLPPGNGPHKTVFMIGGIGAYSIDGDYAGTAYGTILGPLAKSGYAIVRVDKPGQGDSEGPAYTDLMFDDELDGYLQALRLIKTNPRIDKNRIAIFGHSMGGAFGPLVAAQEPVKTVIASGTMSKTWNEYILENTRRQSLLRNAPAGALDDELKRVAAVSKYLFVDYLPLEQIKAKSPELKAAAEDMIPDGKTYSGVNYKFFQQLAQKNLPAAWEKVDGSVLALWGANDFISTEWDHSYIAEIVNRRKPGNGVFKVVPESDHGFFKTSSFADSVAKWGRPGNAFNDNIITILQDWLKERL